MPFYKYLMGASQLTQRADRSRCITEEMQLLDSREKNRVPLLHAINPQLRCGPV